MAWGHVWQGGVCGRVGDVCDRGEAVHGMGA